MNLQSQGASRRRRPATGEVISQDEHIRNFTIRAAIVAVSATVAFALTGCTEPSTTSTRPVAHFSASPTPTPTVVPYAAPPSTSTTESAISVLAAIPVKGKAPLTGYERVADFGPAWDDINHVGCDPRNIVLARDLTNVTKAGSCEVTTGILHDPYTGKIIDFVRGPGTSDEVQIDHVVPLADVWMTGGQQMTKHDREELANDPAELLAVEGPTNEAKGDGDAATWLPPQKSFRCQYVAMQVEVKAKYGLWVARAEHDAITRTLEACPNIQIARPNAGISSSDPTPATPEPAVPVPPVAGKIYPGGMCATQGTAGTSAAGKSYTCGSKGADDRGDFHWND